MQKVSRDEQRANNIHYFNSYVELFMDCEIQRKESLMPDIPVVFKEEIYHIMNFEVKLQASGTNCFFVLKKQEDDFDKIGKHSYFVLEDKTKIESIIDEIFDYVIAENKDVLNKWTEYASDGDKIRVRIQMPQELKGKAWKIVDGEWLEEDAENIIVVLNIKEKIITLRKVYPV